MNGPVPNRAQVDRPGADGVRRIVDQIDLNEIDPVTREGYRDGVRRSSRRALVAAWSSQGGARRSCEIDGALDLRAVASHQVRTLATSSSIWI